MGNSIIWKIEDSIGHLILNNPPGNLMTKSFFEELKILTKKVIPNSNVIAIIIYGNGRHFSAGADLDFLFNCIITKTKIDKKGKITKYPLFLKQNCDSFLFFENLKIPVISAIRGVCLGSALELMLFSHIRICGENALFGFPETGFELMPGLGGTKRILNFTSYSKALELILQGANFNAEEALSLGIVNKIVPKKDVVDISIYLAKLVHKGYNRNLIKEYIEKL